MYDTEVSKLRAVVISDTITRFASSVYIQSVLLVLWPLLITFLPQNLSVLSSLVHLLLNPPLCARFKVLDITLSQNMTMLMKSLSWFFAGIILQSIILPWQLLAFGFILTAYWLFLLHYRKSAVDLQRLDAVSRSPVQARLAEILDGATTVRVFQRQEHFSAAFRSVLDKSTSAIMNFTAAHHWISVRTQIVGAFSVLFSVCVVVLFNHVLVISPGLVAMLIIWSSNFTISLGFMIQAITESEASMTSVERVLTMTELPEEEKGRGKKGWSSGLTSPSEEWPTSGKLQFNNVSLRYRPGLPLSLDGLSFSLRSGWRCGVVGRTGAGKR